MENQFLCNVLFFVMSKKEIKWQRCETAWTDSTAVGENRKHFRYLYSLKHPQASRFHRHANGQLDS
jgi:hypothetical protein